MEGQCRLTKNIQGFQDAMSLMMLRKKTTFQYDTWFGSQRTKIFQLLDKKIPRMLGCSVPDVPQQSSPFHLLLVQQTLYYLSNICILDLLFTSKPVPGAARKKFNASIMKIWSTLCKSKAPQVQGLGAYMFKRW